MVRVRVLEPLLDTVAGLNAAVIPEGRPFAARLMIPVNPFCAAMVTVKAAFPPAIAIDCAKSDGALL